MKALRSFAVRASLPGSLEVLAQIAALPDDALQRPVALADGTREPIQFALYDRLRREQSLVVGASARDRLEIERIPMSAA